MVDLLNEIVNPISTKINNSLMKDKTWALKAKPSLCAKILRVAGTEIGLPVITDVILSPNDPIYNEIKSKIMNSVKYCKNLHITAICNDFLDAFYILQQEHYFIVYGENNVKEKLWFHGTERKNIESICRDNFDWTLNGSAHGCTFGQGVYFSPLAGYSSWYCGTEKEMVMVLASVLISSSCSGSKDLIIPDYCNKKMNLRHDTSGNKRTVFVKYYEDEFYPSYVINFNCSFTAKRNKNMVTNKVCDVDEPKVLHETKKISSDPVGDEDAALNAVIEKLSILNAASKKPTKSV